MFIEERTQKLKVKTHDIIEFVDQFNDDVIAQLDQAMSVVQKQTE